TAKQKEQSATPAQKSFAQDFGLTYPGQVYDKWIKEGLAINTPELPLACSLFKSVSTASAQIASKADAYVKGNMAKIIMAKDDATFNSVRESIITEVKTMGLEAANAEMRKNYKDAQELVKTFMD
ncbi:MAG: hypothetical protein Q7J78_05585, partial [Clostridiales bacterium]|nr:hypothetical protein [Clostridiales bacterium]